MQAVVMTAVGGPEVLELREFPEPQIHSPTQLKVRLEAAGVNPVDTKLRSRGLIVPGALPAVLGCDGAGVVTEVGNGVSRFQPGDEVWFCHGGLGGEPGNYAEIAVVEEVFARSKPKSLGFVQAAAAPLVLLTAWEALFDRAHMSEGQTVLIHAGAGGVGHVAIQLAHQAGARVCTTISTPEKAAFATGLGAEFCIPYKERNFVTAIDEWTEGRGVDLALDTVGGSTFQATIPAVAPYGDLVTLLDPGPADWREARNRNLRIGFELMLTPMLWHLQEALEHQGEILDRCAALIDQGKLRIEVAESMPLAEAARAHTLIGEGHVQGKLVLEIG